MTPTDLPFDEIWLHDFEFVSQPGEHPDVVCLAAHELRSGRTLRLWRDELGEQPPYRTDRGVLFVSFVANAECACHLALGWPLPENVLDLSPAFRNLTNGRQTPEGKGLIGALRYYGLDTIGQKKKDAMRDRIMRGWPFTPEERKQILDYCVGDVDALLRLLPQMLAETEFDLGVALYHGEFAAASALMEHHGVPIDMEIFTSSPTRRSGAHVRDAMVPAIDAHYGVYVRNAAGDWTFNMERFAAYLAREGISLAAAGNRQAQHEAQDLRGHVQRAGHSSKICASCATHATRCAKSSWRSAPTAAIARCCGRSKRRRHARSRKRRSGFSRRRSGCAL